MQNNVLMPGDAAGNYDEKEFFIKNNIKERINNLADKYKNKRIALYGAGQFATDLFEYYDLSKLNIVAVCDKKFEDKNIKKEFFGINCITPDELKDFDCDLILISNYKPYSYISIIKNLLHKTKNASKEITVIHQEENRTENNKKILDEVYETLTSVPVFIKNEKYLSLDEINQHLNKIYEENSLYNDAYHKNHKNRFALTLSQIPVCQNEDEVILEIGSFTYFSLFLKEILGYKNIYGLDKKDSNEKTYTITRTIMNKEHKQIVFNVDLDNENGYSALLDSKIKFDKIIFMEVLEHLYKPILSLINFRKILKENGMLILTTPNSSSLYTLHRLFNMRTPMIYKRMNPENPYAMHVREYTPIDLKYFLKCCGYIEKSFNTINAYNYPTKEYLYSFFPFPNQPDLNKKLVHDTMVSISTPSAAIITEEPDILYDINTYGKEEFIRHNIPIDKFLFNISKDNI